MSALQRWANVSITSPEWLRWGRYHVMFYLQDKSSGQTASSEQVQVSATPLARPTLSPGPLSWLTSSYCVAIILMSVLVNRMQHVVPPRRPYRLTAPLRAALRGPSIAYLCYALCLVASKLPPLVARFPALAVTSEVHSDASLLWTVFLALGLQAITECFCKALDNDLQAQTSVNLLSYSYLLHFHSHPAASPHIKPTPPVYLLIGLTLCETLSLQLMEAFGGNLRLFLTFFFSVIGQATMLTILLRGDLDKTALLPSSTYLNRFPELIFFSLSGLTVALHALSQFISEGQVTRAIFGHPSNLPSRGDDFSIAIIRYGTACLETSALTGFGNEVGLVVQPPGPYIELSRGGASTPALSTVASHRAGRGFIAPEIKDVRARAGVPRDSDPLSRSPAILRECWRFSRAALKLYWLFVRRQIRYIAPHLGLDVPAGRNDSIGAWLRWLGVTSEADLVAHRWEPRAVDDDDLQDDDFTPSERATSPGSESSKSSDGEHELNSPEGSVEPSAFTLVNDMEAGSDEPGDIQAILLAHLMSTTPLTRRRFRGPQDADAALERLLSERRGHRDPNGNAEVQSLCVICRVEQRTIIFWPCRCLAVCEECLEHLAARSHAGSSQHLCVCCRSKVDAYSKVFVP